MRGVVFKGNREAEIREFPDPHAGPGKAMVKIRASGLWGTDLHRYVGVGGPASIDFNRDVIFKVATIYGSWTFSKSELLEIARFMVDAKVPLEKLITHRYTLD
jgi:threonine dehydrogenase-like Zn-dependent dehydrogenase